MTPKAAKGRRSRADPSSPFRRHGERIVIRLPAMLMRQRKDRRTKEKLRRKGEKAFQLRKASLRNAKSESAIQSRHPQARHGEAAATKTSSARHAASPPPRAVRFSWRTRPTGDRPDERSAGFSAPMRRGGMSAAQKVDFEAAQEGKISWREYYRMWGPSP